MLVPPPGGLAPPLTGNPGSAPAVGNKKCILAICLNISCECDIIAHCRFASWQLANRPPIEFLIFLPPATKLGQGYVFICMCDSVHGGRRAWLPGGMYGCWGACMAARVACMVARGMCLVVKGHAWLQGACMVARGRHAWLPWGMQGCWGSVHGEGAMHVEGGHAW